MDMMRTLGMATLLALLGAGCKKEPGEGGKSEIRGYVFEREVNSSTCQPTDDAYALPEARVYIMYGDHDFYDDDVRTGPDGLFVFSWLREGDYRIYAISECCPNLGGCDSGLKAVYASANVDGKEGVTNVGILTIDKR